MRFFAGALIFLAALLSPASAAQIDDEDAIRAKMQIWITAFNNKDADGMKPVYSDNIYYANNGSPLARNLDSIIATYRTQFAVAPLVTIDFSEELVATGPRFGHIAGKYRITVPNAEGQTKQFFGRVLLIFEKQDGDWKMVVDFDNQGSDLSATAF